MTNVEPAARGVANARGNFVGYPALDAIIENRTPALRSFHLGYLSRPSNEQEMQIIGVVIPRGAAQDLSGGNWPEADLPLPHSGLGVYFQPFVDRDADPESFNYVVSYSALDLPGIKRYMIRREGITGHVTVPLPAQIFPDGASGAGVHIDPVLALVGFKLFFAAGRQHELKRVGIWFEDHDLHVAFQSTNPAHDYSFLVDFLVIPAGPNINLRRGTERGYTQGAGRARNPIPNGMDFVLSGWDFNFVGSDRKLTDIGVDRVTFTQTGEDDIAVYFEDNTRNDAYDWRVDWAHISRRVVAPTQ